MSDTSAPPRLKRVVVVDCQGMSNKEMMAKLYEVSELQEASEEDDVLHLMLTCPATVTLEDTKDGKQKMILHLEEISDEELTHLKESLMAMTEYYKDLGIVLHRRRTATLKEASHILNQGD
jgi:hypothetical protein